MVMLKKGSIFIVVCFTILITSICSANFGFGKEKIGILIVGPTEFKTENRYYDIIRENLVPPEGAKYTISTDENLQSAYQQYWLEKGELEEGKPTKEDFFAFSQKSGYDKILFLVIKDPVTDVSERPYMFSTIKQYRTTVTVNAFLCDGQNILAVRSVAQDGDSEASVVRARADAFNKDMRDIGKYMTDVIINHKFISKQQNNR